MVQVLSVRPSHQTPRRPNLRAALSACALSHLSSAGKAVAPDLSNLQLREGSGKRAEAALVAASSAVDSFDATCVECQSGPPPVLDYVQEDEVNQEGGNADTVELPECACAYCDVRTPAALVKCVATGKWFCNNKPLGLPASCIVYHLVRSKHNEAQHKIFSALMLVT